MSTLPVWASPCRGRRGHDCANGSSSSAARWRVGSEDGTYALKPVTHLRYEQRGNAETGTRREYHVIKVTCPHGDDFERRISLFHTDPTSNDPNFNRGEYVRVYPPGSAASKYLYGARNDTEARHADLKARARYLPADRDGQLLRLLGAAIASNAFSWQVHLQAHGENNVIDNTA